MHVSIRLKHIIIPIIVFGISFFGILLNSQQLLLNPTINVGFIYSADDILKNSNQRILKDTLYNYNQDDLPEDSQYKYTSISAQHVSDYNAGKVNEIAKSNEMIFLAEFPIDETIEEVFNKNRTTQFIVFEEAYTPIHRNVATIDVDKVGLATSAAKSLTQNQTTHKYLYVDSDFESEAFDAFEKEVLSNDPDAEIEYFYVENPDENKNNAKLFNEYLNEGYNSIFVNDPQLNDLIVDMAVDYQSSIYVYHEEQLAIELQKEADAKAAADAASEAEATVDENSEVDAVVEPESEKEPEVEVSPYLFDNIQVITTGYDNVEDGVIIDTNEDGISNIDDHSIVIESYVFDYTLIIKELFDTVALDNTSSKQYYIAPGTEYLEVVKSS